TIICPRLRGNAGTRYGTRVRRVACSRSLRRAALTAFVLPRVGGNRERHAVAVGAEAGRLGNPSPLPDLARRTEFPRSLVRSAAEAPGSADRHLLEERAHHRIGIDPEGIHEGAPGAALRFDREDDAHVVGIRD